MKFVDNAAAFMRQLDLANPTKLQIPITIIGAGAIGSHVAVALAKMGCGDLTIWDKDVVSEHNYPNQLFLHEMNGEITENLLKVDVLKATVYQLSGVEITPIPAFYKDTFLEGIVISGVDSMEVRHEIWNAVKFQPAIRRYIDGRMGGQVGQLFHLNPNDIDQVEWYEKNLPTDAETSELPCTARSICYTEFGMAAMIASLVRQELCEDKISISRKTTMDFHNGIICPDEEFSEVMFKVLSK